MYKSTFIYLSANAFNSDQFKWSCKPLLNDKILDWPRFKGYADNTFILVKLARFVMYRRANIGGNRENTGN